MASDTYILVHISLWQWGIQHPIFHMEWICHHISRPITFHIFSHSPRVIRMVSEQPRWKVQENWMNETLKGKDTSSLMGKKHEKSSIVSSNPILGGLSDYIPLYHIIPYCTIWNTDNSSAFPLLFGITNPVLSLNAEPCTPSEHSAALWNCYGVGLAKKALSR